MNEGPRIDKPSSSSSVSASPATQSSRRQAREPSEAEKHVAEVNRCVCCVQMLLYLCVRTYCPRHTVYGILERIKDDSMCRGCLIFVCA